jgi:MFS family permease
MCETYPTLSPDVLSPLAACFAARARPILSAPVINQLHILYLAGLLMDFGLAGFSFALLRRAAELGASPMQLGLLGSVWMGTYTSVALISGRLSDRIGRRAVAASGAGVAGLLVCASALTTSVPVLVGLTAVFGVGVGSFWPAVIAWVCDGARGANLVARLTRFNVAWNIGLLLGFGLTGLVFKQHPRAAFFVAAGAILVLPALFALPSRRAEADQPTSGPAPERVPKGRGFRQTAWLANFALTFAIGGVAAMFPKLATRLDIGADAHGLMLALGRGAALAAFVLLGWLRFWRTRLWPLWLAQCVAGAGILIIGFGSAGWEFALAFIIIGAVSGYTYQASILFTLEEITETGKGSGFHEAVLASGMFLGPLLAGWIGQLTTLRTPYFFGTASVLLLVAVQMLIVSARRVTLRNPG